MPALADSIRLIMLIGSGNAVTGRGTGISAFLLEGGIGRRPSRIGATADHPRPAVQTFRGKRRPLVLPKILTDALKRLSRA